MLFEFKNVSVIRQDKTLLHRISAQIEQESSYTIVGPSGAGKTTFLRLFNLMTIPSSGAIRFRGKPALEYPLIEYRRRIPIVFQEPVLFDGTIRDNLFAPFRIKKWQSEKPTNSQLEKVLSVCRLSSNYLNQNSRTLSGGEKQRVAIARTLLLNPDVLLLDEPTSALDVETADRVIRGIFDNYPGMTLVMVTHAIELLEKIDQKIVLKEGRIEKCCDRLSASQVRTILKEKL